MMNRYVLTGCDKNTEWQLPWFVENFNKVTETELIIVDFGMTPEMKRFADKKADYTFEVYGQGWFSKVEAMHQMKTRFNGAFCWLDTDCELLRDPSYIFDYVEHNKLTVVIDHPWTERGSPWTPQGNRGPWYNTGVVAFEGRPMILDRWLQEIKNKEHRGDQEALYSILNESDTSRLINISEAPHRFNVLRLDMLQNRVPERAVINHWTGQKGNDEIRRRMQ